MSVFVWTEVRRVKNKEKPKGRGIEIRIKVSNDERQAFKAEADKCGINVAAWARMSLRKTAGLIL